MDRHLQRRSVRVGVLAVSLVAAASIGGGFVAGVMLVPLLMLASLHAGHVSVIAYIAVAALLAAELAWGMTLLLVGETRPYIWLIPAVAGLATMSPPWLYVAWLPCR